SILSKKIAEGAESLVIDLKVGSGAFMKSKESGRKLARTLVQVAKKLGLPCRAVLTSMDQPLGWAVGNSLEVLQSVETLSNKRLKLHNFDCGSSDLKELTVQLCAHMLELGGVARNLAEGRKLAHGKLADGSAWKRFLEMVDAQGGSTSCFEDPCKLP